MNDEIIVSLITGLCVAIPNLAATIFSNYQNNKKNEENKKLTIYRLEELETKVNKQNILIERIAKVENEIDSIKEDVQEWKEMINRE